MKKKLFYILIWTVLVAVSGFYSCNDKIDSGTDDRVKGVSIIPNPMTIGGMVSITGPNFKEATKITFPGGVAVTNFTKAGDFQLNAVVPAGAAREGNISVSLPDGEFVIEIKVTIVSTGSAFATSQDINAETGNYRVGPNDALSIKGEGLGAIVEIELPGGLIINNMNFAGKTETSILITIPMGGFNRNAVEPLKMISSSGEVFYTANTIEWNGEGYVPAELLPFCGRSFKVWTWDDQAPDDLPFGNNAYGSGQGPSWWKPAIDTQFGGSGHGWGAKMAFYLPNKMVLTLTNGTVYEGKFAVDMTDGVGTWSSGKLKVTSGDDELSIVGGTRGSYNSPGVGPHYPKVFDIVKLTNAELVLAYQYPEEKTSANFYMFRVKEDEGEGSGGGAVTVPDELKVWVGEGSKIWTWDFDAPPENYGPWSMGAVANGISDWWSPDPDDYWEEEYEGATMTFSYEGKNKPINLLKTRADGSTERGTFTIDWDTKRSYGSGFRGIGQMKIENTTVLTGQCTEGGNVVHLFDILKLTDTELKLAYPVEYDEDDAWRTCTYWYFKPVDK